MKKLIITTFLAIGLISSAFAANLSFGMKGLMGCNVGTEPSGFVTDIAEAKSDVNFLYAGGAYLDLSLLGPVGVQVGANLGKNKISESLDGKKVMEYQELLLDIPLMIWADFKFGPVGLGLGAGPNISFVLNADCSTPTEKITKEDFDMKKAVWGFTTGANLKIFFNKHLAMVAGANYVLDIQKKELTLENVKQGALLEFNRSVLFGDLGLEFKFF